MTHRNIRRAGRARGQTLVLACLCVLVLSLAVLATVNLGHTVHERIRLQNTTDAAAYSMAAMEARAFNFYAFANRAQASHYVTAMLFQSLLSFLYFEEAFLTDVFGVMLTVEPCAGARGGGFWRDACFALEAVPRVGAVLRFIEGAISLYRALVELYQGALRRSAADEVIGGGIIPGLRTLNSGLALLSGQVMEATLAQVIGATGEVIAANDPDVDPSEAQALTGGLSACLFDRAHFREGNGSPLEPRPRPGDPIAPRVRAEVHGESRAKRAMAQVANASRYACGGRRRPCPEGFATDRRRLGELVALPAWLRPISGFLEGIPKWGQARLLTYGLARGWNDDEGGNLIREPLDTPDAPSSMLAQGDNLGADDLYELKLRGPLGRALRCGPGTQRYWECWGEPRRGHRDARGDRPFRFMMKTSIWATNDSEERVGRGGVHWRIAFPGPYPAGKGHVDPSARAEPLRRMGLNEVRRRLAPGLQLLAFAANVRPIEDGNHRWRGLAPFPHFEPGQFAEGCLPGLSRNGAPDRNAAALRRDDFNQPSTWLFLHKGPEALANSRGAAAGAGSNRPALLNAQGRVSLAVGARSTSLELADRRESLAALGFTPGLNVLSRGQCYYHRPGNWAEQPNFFNPYWRPRLAPVLQGRRGMPLVEALVDALPPELRAMPQKAMTH